MKKLLSILLIMVLCLWAFPISSNAVVDKSSTERLELLNLACQIFPEYTSNIRGKGDETNRTTQTGPSELIFCETRAISENERLTYAQFSNNRGVVVLETASAATLEETGSSESIFAGGVSGTLSYMVTPTDEDDFYGVFYLDNFKYRLISATYDSITDIGTPSVNSSIHCLYNRSTPVYQQTANRFASVDYNITFMPAGAYGVNSSRDIRFTLGFGVGNDTVIVELR